MAREFIMPSEIITGEEALLSAGEKFKEMGKKAFIVTDAVMKELGNVEKVEQVLNVCGIPYAVFTGIAGEPTDEMITAGEAVYQEEGCDFLIGLGGGSPIDSMKAIAVVAKAGGNITDYLGKEIVMPLPPMAAIPTTAGTGSEATQFTIITDTQNDVKMLLKGKALMPDLAIIDPLFTKTAPPAITAATGLDALTHAIEAYTSRKAQKLSDTFAISAIKRIFSSLETAYQTGEDIKAREQMAIAALEAGIAFCNASVTLVHGMSRPIGALFHVAHGLSNAMLLKECLEFALDGAQERFGQLGRAIGAADENDTDEKASVKFMQAVVSICSALKVPTLKEYGVDREKYDAVLDKMAQDAMNSGSPQNTRKTVTKEDLIAIYQKVYE